MIKIESNYNDIIEKLISGEIKKVSVTKADYKYGIGVIYHKESLMYCSGKWKPIEPLAGYLSSWEKKFYVDQSFLPINLINLQSLLLNEMIKTRLPKKIPTLEFELEWYKDKLVVGCQAISRKDALALAKAINDFWGK